MVLGEVEETITIVDVNEETLEEVIRVCRNNRIFKDISNLHKIY